MIFCCAGRQGAGSLAGGGGKQSKAIEQISFVIHKVMHERKEKDSCWIGVKMNYHGMVSLTRATTIPYHFTYQGS